MSKTGNIFLTIAILIVPILLAINILTGATQEGKNTTTLGYFAQTISEADIGFSETYIAIAQAGQSWNDIGTTGDFFAEVKNFFDAMWNTIRVPAIMIREACASMYEVIELFFNLLGQQTPAEPTPGSGGPGGGFGGGGGSGT